MSTQRIEFLAVLTTPSKARIAFVKSLLDANKISYYVDNENASSMADTLPQMTVMVTKEQYKFVEELLKNVE